MATTAKMVKELKTPKYKTRCATGAGLCGRPRGYIRKFRSAALFPTAGAAG